jgi:hypothetical protein
MTTDNFCFYLQNRLMQNIQIGAWRYNDTSPFSIKDIISNFSILSVAWHSFVMISVRLSVTVKLIMLVVIFVSVIVLSFIMLSCHNAGSLC